MVSKPPTNAVVDTSGMAHATYGASASERWLNCSGSIALSEKAPPGRDSVYAKEGTEAHSCLEFLIKNRNKHDAALRAARKKYPQEMIEHCVTAFDWIMARYKEYPSADFLCETRVDSSSFTCDGQFGTVDCAIASVFDHLTVIDFKYGAGIAVDPEGYSGKGNSQLVYYALGISNMYHHNFATASIVVIQPRAYHPSGDTIREFQIDMDDLIGWGSKFKAGVARTRKYPDVYTPGAWCKFCPADVICPSLKGDADNASLFSAMVPLGKPEATEVREIPLEVLPGLLQVAERAEKWIEAIREYTLNRLVQGDKIQGWRLAEKKGRRAWIDETKAFEILSDWTGTNIYEEVNLKSPAAMEKIKPPGCTKDAWLELIDDLTETKSSGVTMKKDSREDLSELFAPITINVTPTKGKRK